MPALNLNFMKKNCLALNIFIVIIPVCILLFGSCAPAKNVVYFQNLQKDTTLRGLVNNNFELRIRKNDLLYIGITSPDPVSTPLFNGLQSISMSSSGNTGNSNTGLGGTLVDKEGDIVMYKLGTIHVEGLTRNELRQQLQADLSPYLKDAVITVRFLNNKVTILGEVNKPQVLTMTNEQLSLLEAIAQSGDLTITGRRDNILVIREMEAGKQFKRLNLNDKSIFYSPFFYLKPDDVVYIEPTKYKINNPGEKQQIISYVLSGLSVAITLLFYLFPHR